jgi:UDP-glucose 4-epimerase
MNSVLVTGGLGYIGSHTTVNLIENGYHVIIIDNLCNSNIKVLDNIEKITGIRPTFFKGDINNKTILNNIFKNFIIDNVIHFAALKSVSESITKPIEYYKNNVSGTINLISAMKDHGVKNIIFSSSCTVYGEPETYPVNELTPTQLPKTPYGVTKSMCEKILEDTTEINSIALRYFNPIGNHKSGLIYENPNGVPENLMPYIIGVIEGKYYHLRVFGNDYNTLDGTAIRDYIDVNDLAEAHVKALNNVDKMNYDVINVGTGNGYSVLEVIKAFEDEGITVPYKIYPRRDGDIEQIYANIIKAKNLMNWEPKRGIKDSVKSILTKINQ